MLLLDALRCVLGHAAGRVLQGSPCFLPCHDYFGVGADMALLRTRKATPRQSGQTHHSPQQTTHHDGTPKQILHPYIDRKRVAEGSIVSLRHYTSSCRIMKIKNKKHEKSQTHI